ncbi:hypothetical protein [Mycobacterium sp.]|nr:hypothetical protein [Mycobacterium sp.]
MKATIAARRTRREMLFLTNDEFAILIEAITTHGEALTTIS